ncbi:hypothetical protein [Sinomonas sp. P10A9]|uniref:Uncharacterized protein n=1 Tax=Sinomonas puerhi TaxID=3238584 RepID=A0AB39L0I6_9MICC
MAKYVLNPHGVVHSLTEADYDNYLTEWVDGRPYLKHGYTELTEAEAKTRHPQLFGAPDPAVLKHQTVEELARAAQRQRLESEILGNGTAE